MSELTGLILILVTIGIALYVASRFFRNRADAREDAAHLSRLLGRNTPAEGEPVDEAVAEKAPGRIERRLQATGLRISPSAAVILIILLAILVALAVAVSSPGLYWASPIAALATIWLITSTLSEMARQRSWRFENRLVDAIDLAVGALSAGLAPADALASAAEGSLEPVKSELRDLANQLLASVPIERAVRGMALRYDSEGVRIFTQLLIAKWEVGGPLGPALQAVTRTMRHGLRLRGQLHTQISGAQTSAIIVAILPYLLVAIFLWKRPQALAIVWQLRWGPQLFVGAILLQLAGFIWLRRILRIEL